MMVKKYLIFVAFELRALLKQSKEAGRIMCVGCFVATGLLILKLICHNLNSLALTAFSELILFDVLSLAVSLVSLRVRQQTSPSTTYSYGYERFEVVAVFTSTILTILSSFFLLKEAVERFFDPSLVFADYLPGATLLALSLHGFSLYSVQNPAFAHVTQASSSNWLQEHVSDMSRSLCNTVPGLSRILLPRLNPISLVGVLIVGILFVVYFLLGSPPELPGLPIPDPFPDTVAAIIISFLLFSTMFPMAVYCGRILLQTTPLNQAGMLDKALREASTLEGVLELCDEHFWSVTFTEMAGSLSVRVRRDANEQLVLAHVINRLQPLVKRLTVQVIKDDWVRSPTPLTYDWTVPLQPPPQQQISPAFSTSNQIYNATENAAENHYAW